MSWGTGVQWEDGYLGWTQRPEGCVASGWPSAKGDPGAQGLAATGAGGGGKDPPEEVSEGGSSASPDARLVTSGTPRPGASTVLRGPGCGLSWQLQKMKAPSVTGTLVPPERGRPRQVHLEIPGLPLTVCPEPVL